MFKTITSRFAGKCRRCQKAGICDGRENIAPGQKIRWARGAGSYHLSAECPASGAEPVPAGHAPDLDAHLESEAEAWHRRAEEGWGPGGY